MANSSKARELKQVRSHTVDRTCNTIDHQLSEWFFNRMMGIRMEARPASVGTLAGQVKGFEMVRGVLASTSLFVLADVPFTLFFLLVIALIGGWVVAVPLIALPIALVAGLVTRRRHRHHGRQRAAALFAPDRGAFDVGKHLGQFDLDCAQPQRGLVDLADRGHRIASMTVTRFGVAGRS